MTDDVPFSKNFYIQINGSLLLGMTEFTQYYQQTFLFTPHIRKQVAVQFATFAQIRPWT